MTRPMTRPKLGTIAIAVCLVAMPAAAAEFTRTPQADGPDVITIRGEIEPDDHKKFIEIAPDIMQTNFILNSKGGHIGAAIIIGRSSASAIMKPKCTMRSNAFTLSRTL
jgi:hypothetical protein